jgi:kynurenine 3-monooxygenase
MSKQKVLIVGAGLSGSLLAIYLAKKGILVDVFESRSDMRTVQMVAGRSINLALSDRGIMALREVGMDEYMLKEAIPMKGRMIHSLTGQTNLQPYSGRQGEYINSVSRGGLNIALMNEAEKYEGVNFYFDHRAIGFEKTTCTVLFEHPQTGDKKIVKGDTVIGTDGAGSAIRNTMLHGGVDRFNFSQRFLEHGYKELCILPGKDGGFLMEKNALHIWPRGSYMMIALPNFDASFTCTLFLAHEGEKSFKSLTPDPSPKERGEKLMEFFQSNFPDAVPLMPTLAEDFFYNPTGSLGTIKCFPWNIGGKSLLLGDSAHAVVPFYGQGMNCAFEDCRSLNTLIDQHGDDWEKVYIEYGKQRKADTDAIADMAEENFYEMRDYVADPVFMRKRELETKLEQLYPDYFSKYSMVTFREDLPYNTAMKKGRAQDQMLMNICSGVDDVKKLNLDDVIKKIKTITVS